MVMVTVVVMEVVMVMVIGPNGESTRSGDDDGDGVQHFSTRDKILTLDEKFCFRFHQLRKQSDLVLIRSVQVQFLKKKTLEELKSYTAVNILMMMTLGGSMMMIIYMMMVLYEDNDDDDDAVAGGHGSPSLLHASTSSPSFLLLSRTR